jgi:hypothetical protein
MDLGPHVILDLSFFFLHVGGVAWALCVHGGHHGGTLRVDQLSPDKLWGPGLT